MRVIRIRATADSYRWFTGVGVGITSRERTDGGDSSPRTSLRIAPVLIEIVIDRGRGRRRGIARQVGEDHQAAHRREQSQQPEDRGPAVPPDGRKYATHVAVRVYPVSCPLVSGMVVHE